MALADGIVGNTFQPGCANWRVKWFVDDAARKENEAAALFGRRVNDLSVAAVGVHADKQIEILGHCLVEFPVDVTDASVTWCTDTLAAIDVFEFVGEGLRCGVDNGRFPPTLLEQVSQQPFAAANISRPAGFKPFHQPAVQQLKAELLHFAQFAGCRWVQSQRMRVQGRWRHRIGEIACADSLQFDKQLLAVFLVVPFTHSPDCHTGREEAQNVRVFLAESSNKRL